MATRLQKKFETEQRRNRVEDLYLLGHSLRWIGRELGVHFTTVSNDIEVIRSEWRATRVQKLDDEINHQLAKLDRIEAQAWIGWERSLRNGVEQIVESGDSKDGPYTKKRKKKAVQSGDPRFLKIIDDALASRRQLLGLNAAQKMEMTNIVKSIEVEVRSPEDVITLHDLIHKTQGENN